jgi:hypothetical protein
MRNLSVAAAFALSGLAGLGCSSNSQSGPPGGNQTDAAPGDGGFTGCTTDPLALTYASNMVQHGAAGNLSFQLVSVMVPNEQGVMTAAPPSVGSNRWVIKVLDKSGAPVTGATFPLPTVVPVGCPQVPGGWPVGVYACMPHHGHATTSYPSLTPNGDGTYTIDGLYLYMVGLWEVVISAKAGTTTDSVNFGFCIDG